jgi:hypothetical protein
VVEQPGALGPLAHVVAPLDIGIPPPTAHDAAGMLVDEVDPELMAGTTEIKGRSHL